MSSKTCGSFNKIKEALLQLIEETWKTYYTKNSDGSYTTIPGARSVKTGTLNECAYIGPQGKRCAASRLAPEQTVWYETAGIHVDDNWRNIRPILYKRLFGTQDATVPLDLELRRFVKAIQAIHDQTEHKVQHNLQSALDMVDELAKYAEEQLPLT